jgi:hypothetical protein
MIFAALAAMSPAWAEDETATAFGSEPANPVETVAPAPRFRLVKVETRPLGQRINIQIKPEEQYDVTRKVDPRLPQRPMAPLAGGTFDRADWFWSALSPRLTDGSDTRMQEAMALLRDHPFGAARLAPDARFMRRLAQKYGREILQGTLNKRVSPAFVLAVIGVESSGDSNAVSSAGATGLMQLIPDTAKRFGVTEITDPTQNIAGGAAYLDWLLAEFGQDPLLALAGYNAGENAVKQYGGIPPFAETRNYVPKVVAAWQVARNLCKTPPDHVWQGCVFN